jgi:CubicO group peptidase (beta-lactamase class C family)
VLSDGFGVRHVGTGEPVDEKTFFAIASNTKAFTAAALGILVDEGKVSWDDKVVDYLPWFRLYDAYVTQHMTLRDLLCHRSGLKTFSGDLLWYGTQYSRREVVERARFLEPTYGFRSHFGYSNIMYLAAGLVVEEVSGMTWDNFVARHFFRPLGMSRTITSVNDLKKLDNISAPHNETPDGVIAIDYLNWDNIAPAGAIISCVDDLARWIQLQLHHGVYGNDTLFSAAVQREMWSPQIPLQVARFEQQLWPSMHFKSYGLGWSLFDYHGEKIVTHNGGYDGMISQTVLIPGQKSGFVILTNSLSGMYKPLMYETLDYLLDISGPDYMEIFNSQNQKYEEWKLLQQQKKDSLRQIHTHPSLALKAYSGTYLSEAYGPVEVSLSDGKLSFSMQPAPQFHSVMNHWHFDTFEIGFAEFPSLPRGWVTFRLDQDGRVEALEIDVPNPDFDFTEFDFLKVKN